VGKGETERFHHARKMMAGRSAEVLGHAGGIGKDLSRFASLQVEEEKAVRIVEVGKDQIEIADVIHPGGIEDRARGEERAERPVIHRAGGVEVEAAQCDLGNAGMAEDFDVRVRPAFANEPHGGQGEDEVAQRTPSNKKNIFHEMKKVTNMEIKYPDWLGRNILTGRHEIRKPGRMICLKGRW
jgi:hypothetical protein